MPTIAATATATATATNEANAAAGPAYISTSGTGAATIATGIAATGNAATVTAATVNAAGIIIERVHQVSDAQLQGLAALLTDCVDGGASVSFMHPLSPDKALAFWRQVADGVAHGTRALLVAADAHGIVGTVQLVLEQPENQPHRADLSKMLVHRRARRHGLGAALMRAAEQLGRDCGKSLLVLDTVTGGDGERLYARLGWERCGTIPGFALMPDGAPCATTYFYRRLDA